MIKNSFSCNESFCNLLLLLLLFVEQNDLKYQNSDKEFHYCKFRINYLKVELSPNGAFQKNAVLMNQTSEKLQLAIK